MQQCCSLLLCFLLVFFRSTRSVEGQRCVVGRSAGAARAPLDLHCQRGRSWRRPWVGVVSTWQWGGPFPALFGSGQQRQQSATSCCTIC